MQCLMFLLAIFGTHGNAKRDIFRRGHASGWSTVLEQVVYFDYELGMQLSSMAGYLTYPNGPARSRMAVAMLQCMSILSSSSDPELTP